MGFWDSGLGELVFPPLCHGCGDLLAAAEKPFCPPCVHKIPGLNLYRCSGCGTVKPDQTLTGQATKGWRCPSCIDKPLPWDFLFALGSYDGQLRDWILAQKGRRGEWFAEILGRFFADFIPFPFQSLEKVDAVIPVPRHWTKRWWFGHNPAEGLARGLCGIKSWHLERFPLFRTRPTARQSDLTPNQRKTNVKGAFAWRGRLQKNATALLVDDVYTTGATMMECSKTLKAAGFSQIAIAVLALGKTRTTHPVRRG